MDELLQPEARGVQDYGFSVYRQEMGLVLGGEGFIILDLLVLLRAGPEVTGHILVLFLQMWGAVCMWWKIDIYHPKATDLGTDPVLLKGSLLPCIGQVSSLP